MNRIIASGRKQLMIQANKTPDGSGAFFWGLSVRFGSKADTQKRENCRTVEIGAQDASVSVRFRPIADIREPAISGKKKPAEAGDTEAKISGELNDATLIEGTDSVNIVP